MPTHPLVDTVGVEVDAARLQAFTSSFRGAVIRAGDAQYDVARRIWNASIDKYPGLIARCTGLADVIAAVRFARENRLLVAIRGGGHNVGGRAVCDGGMVIDLSGMKGIHVDPEAKRVRAQPGVLLAELDRETHVYGMTVPLGAVSKTGIAGLTLGGGVGWLARKYGLTCDNVISFELVTADGEVRRASASENPDLFWALRGGGGNFGVVTSFEYRLCPVAMVLGGLLVHPRDRATDLLRFYRSFTQSAPDELAAYAALLHTPDGVPVAAVAVCYNGDLGEGERVLAPLRAFGPPMADLVQPMPMPGIPTRVERRRDRDDPRAHQPGELAAHRGPHRAVRRGRQPRRDHRHGVRAAPRAVRSRHPDPMDRSRRIGTPHRLDARPRRGDGAIRERRLPAELSWRGERRHHSFRVRREPRAARRGQDEVRPGQLLPGQSERPARCGGRGLTGWEKTPLRR
jgi:hypothetical protein